MKLPRDCSGTELIKALTLLGYTQTRQTGSHVRITTNFRGEHHVTIPSHSPMRVGTLHAILKDVAEHHAMSVEDLVLKLKL